MLGWHHAVSRVTAACCCCCCVQVGDGSFDKFLSKFITINTDGLGYIDSVQLGLHLASINGSSSSSDPKSSSRGSSRAEPSSAISTGSAAVGARGGAGVGAGGKPRQSSAMSTASTRLSSASRYTSSTPVGGRWGSCQLG
jgi:hypothetical protein